MTTILPILVVISYVATWLLIGSRVKQRLNHETLSHRTPVAIIWTVAILLHGFLLYYPIFETKTFSLHFTSAYSHVAWVTTLLLFITSFNRRLETLSLAILPFTILGVILNLSITPSTEFTTQLAGGLGIHVFISILAYSLLTLATLLAILLAIQNQHLHNHHPGGLIRTLPALQDMESLLFRMILAGVVLLSFALLSGFIYLDNLLGSGIAHKTILSLIAWFVFTGLLLGHYVYGWRGKTAIRWTISGFALLMLGYLGSKFIIEFIVR